MGKARGSGGVYRIGDGTIDRRSRTRWRDVDRGVSCASVPAGVLTMIRYDFGYAWLSVLVETPVVAHPITAVSDDWPEARIHSDFLGAVHIRQGRFRGHEWRRSARSKRQSRLDARNRQIGRRGRSLGVWMPICRLRQTPRTHVPFTLPGKRLLRPGEKSDGSRFVC